MSDAVVHHVADLITDLDPGAFVTKYVLVAEVIDTDGARAIWTSTEEDATRWDTYGLLMYALEKERSREHVEAMYDDDE